MTTTPLGTTEVTIRWEDSDIQDWAYEYDQRYQEISQGWSDLIEGVAAQIAPIAQGFMQEADDLIQKEQRLNEDMWGRAVGYIGQAITFNETPLAQICPLFAIDLKGMKIAEIYSTKNIANMTKIAADTMGNQRVMTTISFDVQTIGTWLQDTADKYAEIDRRYQQAIEDAFTSDVADVMQFLSDIEAQIRATTTLTKVPMPVNMRSCYDEFFWDIPSEELCPGNIILYDSELDLCYVEICEEPCPYMEALDDLKDNIEDVVEEAAEEIAGNVAEFAAEVAQELSGDFQELAEQIQERWGFNNSTNSTDGWDDWEYINGTNYTDSWDDWGYNNSTNSTDGWNDWDYNNSTNFTDGFMDWGTESTDIWDSGDYSEMWDGWYSASSPTQQSLVKSAPSSDYTFGVAVGAGICLLGIGAIALYKKTRKPQTTQEEPLLGQYAANP